MNVHLSEPCMPWGGRINADGYGTISGGLAHRVAYLKHVGPIPAGFTIDHLCHTVDKTCPGGLPCPHRRCVELSHLQPVPHGVNVRRGRNHFRDTTHCPAGHAYDEVNTLVSNGARLCRTCRREKRSARGFARTTCSNGHPYDGVNARGYRTCSICMSMFGKAAMASRWASVSSRASRNSASRGARSPLGTHGRRRSIAGAADPDQSPERASGR